LGSGRKKSAVKEANMAKVKLQKLSLTPGGFMVGATVEGKVFTMRLPNADMEAIAVLPPDQRRKDLAQRVLTAYRARIARDELLKALTGEENLP
jgi:hypothetical protein